MTTRRVQDPGDADLVHRARLGDESAFSELVRTHKDEVFTLALRMVSNRELAADVAQEAFIRAWKALPGFRGEAAFSTWLHRITVNTAWTQRRRWRRHLTAPLPDDAPVAAEGLTPEGAGEQVALRGSLSRELALLPESQRMVVVLKDVYGWSHREVAESLGITVAAAKVRLHRARRTLRQQLWGER